MEDTETGRLDQAEETFRQVLALAQAQAFPQWEAQAYYSLGVVLDRSGKYRKAIPFFERGLALFSEHGTIRMEVGCCIFLANMLTKTGEPGHALPILLHALEQADKGLSSGDLPPPEHAYELYGVYRELGRAYRGIGQYEQAHAMYQQALQIDVRYTGTREDRALYMDILDLFLEEGKLEEARTFGEHILEQLDPSDADNCQVLAEIVFQLGIVYLRSRDFPNSLRYSKQSYEYFSQTARTTAATPTDTVTLLAFFGKLCVNIGSAFAGIAGSFENIVTALAYWRCGETLLGQVDAPDVTVPRKNIAGLQQFCGEQIGPGAFISVWEASGPLCQKILAGTPFQEDAWVNPFPPILPTYPAPGPAARRASQRDAQQLLKETLTPLQQECTRLLRLGERALSKKNYRLARRHFGAAMEEDVMDETSATFYYALTCLYLGELAEATEYFGKDRGERADAMASLLLYEWCQMCQHPTAVAYVEKVRDEVEEVEDPLDALELMSEAHEANPATEVFAAIMQLVRGDGQACLVRLIETEDKWRKGPMPWLALFWLGMAYASLAQSEQARVVLHEGLASGMPPLLLLPLRWLEKDGRQAAFISSFVAPLFRSYELAYPTAMQ